MKELKTLREGWADRAAEEAKISPTLSIQKSVQQFFALYQTFASQFKETEDIFGPERCAHLLEFQYRLKRIADWQLKHGAELVAGPHSTSKTIE